MSKKSEYLKNNLLERFKFDRLFINVVYLEVVKENNCNQLTMFRKN